MSETKEKLRRRQFQSEFKDTLTKLEALTQFLSKRQKRNAVIELSQRQNAVEGLVDMVEDTADAASEVVEGAVEVAEGVVEETVDVVEEVADGVSEAASDVVDEITDVVDEVIPGTGDAVDAVGDIGAAAGDLVGDVIQVLTESGSNVLDIFTDVVESVGTALEEVTNQGKKFQFLCFLGLGNIWIVNCKYLTNSSILEPATIRLECHVRSNLVAITSRALRSSKVRSLLSSYHHRSIRL